MCYFISDFVKWLLIGWSMSEYLEKIMGRSMSQIFFLLWRKVDMKQKKNGCRKKKMSLNFASFCIIPISFYLKLSPHFGCHFY